MIARDTLSDLFAIGSLFAAITARQEEIEWLLRSGASAVAIVAGLVAIWFRVFPRKEKPPRQPID